MKKILFDKIGAAIAQARTAGELTSPEPPNGVTVEVPKMTSHGDWATNAAMIMAKAEKKNPRAVAETLIRHLDDPDGFIEKTEVAGPGFINFTLSTKWWHHCLREVLRRGPAYGRGKPDQPRKVQVEFVSANPTGPLHVGHGRGAALGDALARVMAAAGHDVSREYYINDAGRQMQTLGRSVLYRYRELFGQAVDFHQDLYQGDYIRDLAVEVRNLHGDKYLAMPEDQAVAEIYPYAADQILQGIKDDLRAFNVVHEAWFSELSLYATGQVDAALGDLKERGFLFEEGGALWFAATRFGDDKDRVLVKSNGEKTYFASDIAYHRDKFKRGFDLVINLWGADHHGYVHRLKSGVEALGYEKGRLEVLLVQMVNLLRNGVPVAMSTRAGEFVTLADVVKEVGADAARFMFLTRRSDSQLDFDLEVAKSQSAENPVYYVQYAHARIASVFKTAAEVGLALPGPEEANLDLLVEEKELALMRHLAGFPALIEGAAASLEPHRLTHYLTELAKLFHPYYKEHRFVGDDLERSKARLVLAQAVKHVVANGLNLLGISAPETM